MRPDAAFSADSSLEAQRLDGAAVILERLRELECGSCRALAFQRSDWLAPLYQSLAVSLGAEPVAVEIKDAATGALALFVPLMRTKSNGLKTVSAASLGVSDYSAPVLGPAAPKTAAGAADIVNVLKGALASDDVLDLSNMPRVIDGEANPLALASQAVPSRHAAHTLTIETTVDAMIASRGKKYRKESERCFRLLAEKGTPSFRRAETAPEIAHAYAVLEAQQASRRADDGDRYVLDRPAYAKFYADALRDGSANGSAHIFTLKAGDETGAVLFGISHQGTFTLLRISTAQDDAWKRLSPGRLIVIETMRHFVGRGITTFDMGIGSYAFKHGFGIEPQPLTDLIVPLSAKAWPQVMLVRAKAKLRQHPGLMRLLGRAS